MLYNVSRWLRPIMNFLGDDSGPTAVEYAIMLALILVVCISAITGPGIECQQHLQLRRHFKSAAPAAESVLSKNAGGGASSCSRRRPRCLSEHYLTNLTCSSRCRSWERCSHSCHGPC